MNVKNLTYADYARVGKRELLVFPNIEYANAYLKQNAPDPEEVAITVYEFTATGPCFGQVTVFKVAGIRLSDDWVRNLKTRIWPWREGAYIEKELDFNV